MTVKELKERQLWTLDQKIDHTLGTLEAFVNRMGGIDNVYVSFSGGKDSTVLFHLARQLYPEILGVFCNTGNEYPDIVRFVKQTQADGANIQIIRPKMTPREVWAKYGFPLVGKETSDKIHRVRNNPNTKTAIMLMGKSFFSLNNKWRFLVSAPPSDISYVLRQIKERTFPSI